MSTSLDPGLLEAARRIDDLRARGRAAFEQADRIESALQAAQEQLRVALGTADLSNTIEVVQKEEATDSDKDTVQDTSNKNHKRKRKRVPKNHPRPRPLVIPEQLHDTAERFRLLLSEHSLTAAEVASTLKLKILDVENTLAELRRAGVVHRFEKDDRYTWKIWDRGKGDMEEIHRRDFVIRLMCERHITRRELKIAMGMTRGDGKFSRDVDNTITAIRKKQPVHMVENAQHEEVFWLVKGKKGFVDPDKSMDGRIPKGGEKKPHK